MFSLDYLREQDLEEAYDSFCRTSHYLRDEHKWLQKGYRPKRPYDINLVELLREFTSVKCAGKQSFIKI